MWKQILAQLIAAAIPELMKRIPEIIEAIFGWFAKASEKEVATAGKNFGEFMKAAQKELA